MNKKVAISITPQNLSDLVYRNFDEDIREKYITSVSDDGIDKEYDVVSLVENEDNIPEDFSNQVEILSLPEGYSIEYIIDPNIDGVSEIIIGKDLRRIELYDTIEHYNYKGVGLLPEDREKIKDLIIPYKIEK